MIIPLIFLFLAAAEATNVVLLGRASDDYTPLGNAIKHALHHQMTTVTYNISQPKFEKDAVVFLPGYDTSLFDTIINNDQVPVLVVGAELDGVTRFSQFATTRHRHASTNHHFVVVKGAAHHSFTPPAVNTRNILDLQAEVSDEFTRAQTTILIEQWLNNSTEFNVAKRDAYLLAAPIIKALELEGSSHTGKDICNSDYPTNNKCNYPKYPDFSLPPGPAPAPSPLPSADCICGSKWVTDYAFPSVAGASDKGFTVHAADAFHDVSDTHPFHLPHNWNTCTSPSGCNLNVTTLTMSVNGSGTLFPNASAAPPLSALELRTKMKSRKIIWEAAGLGKQSGDVDKKNMTLCKRANQMAWDWALTNADSDVRARFEKAGEPFVMVDDVEAPIGLTGPTWIKKELKYTRTAKNTIEIQSWTFVVPESPIKSKYLPTGMHYCKLLSPARCMEWIYTDGLRHNMGL
jgi:hypothetical protein